MPDSQNLGLFLESLSITNLIVGDYIDWIHVPNNEYDDSLIACSYSSTTDLFEPINIEHVSGNNLFVHPVYRPTKNISYTFNTATWTRDHFDLNITIEKDGISHTGTYSLALVKTMIAHAPKKRTMIDRFREHFELF